MAAENAAGQPTMVALTPELREAITRVFDDGQQDWDRGAGWPPEDAAIYQQYRLVYPLTTHFLRNPNAEL